MKSHQSPYQTLSLIFISPSLTLLLPPQCIDSYFRTSEWLLLSLRRSVSHMSRHGPAPRKYRLALDCSEEPVSSCAVFEILIEPSVILVSPTNQILLLHRVQTASSFPSAHVFPGGNISAEQDGELPPEGDPLRHEDLTPYRLAAIRECFEESGILLAVPESQPVGGPQRLLDVSETEREEGRREVHSNRVRFTEWLRSHGARADTSAHAPV